MVLLDAGERLRPAPLEVKRARSRAWLQAGWALAAGYGFGGDGGGGVVLFDVIPLLAGQGGAGRQPQLHVGGVETVLSRNTPYRRTIRSFPWPHDLPEAERKQAEGWRKSTL